MTRNLDGGTDQKNPSGVRAEKSVKKSEMDTCAGYIDVPSGSRPRAWSTVEIRYSGTRMYTEPSHSGAEIATLASVGSGPMGDYGMFPQVRVLEYSTFAVF
jgi:hypothetical protein